MGKKCKLTTANMRLRFSSLPLRASTSWVLRGITTPSGTSITEPFFSLRKAFNFLLWTSWVSFTSSTMARTFKNMTSHVQLATPQATVLLTFWSTLLATSRAEGLATLWAEGWELFGERGWRLPLYFFQMVALWVVLEKWVEVPHLNQSSLDSFGVLSWLCSSFALGLKLLTHTCHFHYQSGLKNALHDVTLPWHLHKWL